MLKKFSFDLRRTEVKFLSLLSSGIVVGTGRFIHRALHQLSQPRLEPDQQVTVLHRYASLDRYRSCYAVPFSFRAVYWTPKNWLVRIQAAESSISQLGGPVQIEWKLFKAKQSKNFSLNSLDFLKSLTLGRWLSQSLWFMFFIYPICSIEVLGMFSCTYIGPDSWLQTDLATRCPLADKTSFLFVWTVMSTVVYPIGIPVLMLCGLYLFEVPKMAR